MSNNKELTLTEIVENTDTGCSFDVFLTTDSPHSARVKGQDLVERINHKKTTLGEWKGHSIRVRRTGNTLQLACFKALAQPLFTLLKDDVGVELDGWKAEAFERLIAGKPVSEAKELQERIEKEDLTPEGLKDIAGATEEYLNKWKQRTDEE